LEHRVEGTIDFSEHDQQFFEDAEWAIGEFQEAQGQYEHCLRMLAARGMDKIKSLECSNF